MQGAQDGSMQATHGSKDSQALSPEAESIAKMHMLSAFLDEVEHLELQLEPYLDDLSQPIPAKDGAKKIKLSSTQRMKQEKALLLNTINKLQHELVHARRANWYAFAQDLVKRSRLRNLRLRQLHAKERRRAETVTTLVNQLGASMSALAYSIAIPGLYADSNRDASIFHMLDRSLREKNECLIRSWQQGYLPVLDEETIDTVVSMDGAIVSGTVVRFLPFDILAISETAWRTRQTRSDDSCTRTVYRQDASTLAVKEELRQVGATLCVHKVIKVFVHERHTVFFWEVVYEWSTLKNPETITTTQESGWVLIQPVMSESGPLSVVQEFMKMTSSKDHKAWMQLTPKSDRIVKTIGPSYQQIMLDRLQFVENHLMDDAMVR